MDLKSRVCIEPLNDVSCLSKAFDTFIFKSLLSKPKILNSRLSALSTSSWPLNISSSFFLSFWSSLWSSFLSLFWLVTSYFDVDNSYNKSAQAILPGWWWDGKLPDNIVISDGCRLISNLLNPSNNNPGDKLRSPSSNNSKTVWAETPCFEAFWIWIAILFNNLWIDGWFDDLLFVVFER